MVDFITPLPPTNPRVTKARVTEKDPHHQNEREHKKEQEGEEIQDEVVIESVDTKEESKEELSKKHPPFPLTHNIDIEV